MLVASLFPQIIASHIGAEYVKQTLEFKSPVYSGEEITGEVQAVILRQMEEKYMAKFTTKCFKDGGILVIDLSPQQYFQLWQRNKPEELCDVEQLDWFKQGLTQDSS